MDIVSTLISLASGGIGGNVAGSLSKENSLGALGNTVAGLVGGAAGGYILQAVGFLNAMGLGDLSVGSILGNVGASGAGGVVLTALVGMIKNAMNK
jgi:uncharacterized membrane protein YeaQ/YmgE (transglycosylase-associated protein family)